VTLQEFAFLLVSVLMSVSGQLFLKMGALKLGAVDSSNFINKILAIATTPELVFGLTFYACSAVLYILLLTRIKLSVIGPAVAIGYIFSVLIGHFVFGETVPMSRIAGLGLIACGVVLVVWKT
jgi:multidrug transporter EmrE-like cation transporter